MEQRGQNEVIQLHCEKAAVFSDIHSNYAAFHACYEDAKRHGVTAFVFLGDYISDLAQPRETLDLVYEIRSRYPTVCLRGNRERYMLEYKKGKAVFSRGSKTGSLLFTFEQLRQKDLEFFEHISSFQRICVNGITMEAAHASKEDDRFYFESGSEQIQKIFEQMDCEYLLTGHSHKQYIQTLGSKTVINPGSVGVPQGGCHLAQYALLETAGGVPAFQFRQIDYDRKATVRAQFASGLTEYAPCWAVSVLYDVITGSEYTMKLLKRVQQSGNVYDEEIWQSHAAALEMKFTEPEIAELLNH